MNAHPTETLSEYVDDELTRAERGRVEAHLATCAECAGLVADLRAVVAAAGEVADAPPATDLWPGIARRIAERGRGPEVVALESRRGPRRLTLSISQLVAASLAVALLSAAAVWTALREPETGVVRAPEATAPAGTVGTGRLVSDTGAEPLAFAEYEAAVAELERILDEMGDRIDPATRSAFDENLAIIDGAIRQTRRALESDPDDVYLNTHLANTMQRKIDVLQGATRLARASI
ncbi:MAG TPA: zf-HC2 domain-containing protein [Gemmatimonadota bacterium]|nr:zf-HC2 domain-containing protein [Gemmatimonadota bacterium]